MSPEIKSEFEQTQLDGRVTAADSAGSTASTTSGARYGYGYGYSDTNYGDSELSLAHYRSEEHTSELQSQR